MKEEEKLRLKKLYAELPEQQLLDMLSEDEKAYQEGAYELLLEEAKKRDMEEKIAEVIKIKNGTRKAKCAQPEEFKQIFETYNKADIAFLKSLLEANGINFIVENENYNTIRPFSGVPMILKVEARQLVDAEELLNDFQGGNFGQGKVG
jgi:histidyl-tRNA synthetase